VSVFRLEPQGAPELYKTYEVARPRSTHTRAATCREVACQARERGWRKSFDSRTDLGKRQLRYVRLNSGRRFVRILDRRPGMVTLEFAAGQECFEDHRIALDVPALFMIKGGDWRGNPRGTPTVRMRPEDWADDLGNHQLKIAEAIERG
jgi:hypothetical protein